MDTPAKPAARERGKTVGHSFMPRHLRMLQKIAQRTTRGNQSGALQDMIERHARELELYEPHPSEVPRP